MIANLSDYPYSTVYSGVYKEGDEGLVPMKQKGGGGWHTLTRSGGLGGGILPEKFSKIFIKKSMKNYNLRPFFIILIKILRFLQNLLKKLLQFFAKI